jgi:2-oxo-4-hydroxy-4-carboxy-5-ureidoimidazoline decarboxylase
LTVERLNGATSEQARDAFLACCGSARWADRMLATRPFPSSQELHDEAEAIWFSLAPGDWLEAFSQHPKIGEKSSSKWSVQEQQVMSQAGREIGEAIRQMNEQYERTFGWIFIVCATGKSAEQMRSLLEQRLSNDTETELRIAAAEQAKIMHLRLDKLLTE